MTEDNFLTNSNDSNESNKIRLKILELVTQYYDLTHKPGEFVPGKSNIPVSGKVFDNFDLKMLTSSSLDFWLTSGRFNDEFEKQLSCFLDTTFALTTNSGSSSNLLALSALTSELLGEKSLKPNDEVITVAAGFPTTVNPILQNNLTPVFVDVDLPTYQVNVSQVEQAITEKTKAIVLAHTLGNPFAVDQIKKLADKHNLWLIEDCCDALGSTYDGKLVGTFGDISTLSFYPAHHITTGEGGAVFTSNPTLRRLLESFRDWGRDCFCAPGKNNTCGKRFCWQLGDLPEGYDHKYIYSHTGYNLKMTDMQASVGLAQMKKLPDFIKKRKSNFKFLKEELAICDEHLLLPEPTPKSDPSWFGFPITINSDKFSREDLVLHLNKNKIDTRPVFAGNLTKQPYFKNKKFRVFESLSNTDKIMNSSFWIGVYPGLTEKMLSHIVTTIKYFIKEK